MEVEPIPAPIVRRRPNSKTKRKIIERDDFRCQYCGHRYDIGDYGSLTVDHVQPFARGGTNHRSNLVAACIDCNRIKADSQNIKPIRR